MSRNIPLEIFSVRSEILRWDVPWWQARQGGRNDEGCTLLVISVFLSFMLNDDDNASETLFVVGWILLDVFVCMFRLFDSLRILNVFDGSLVFRTVEDWWGYWTVWMFCDLNWVTVWVSLALSFGISVVCLTVWNGFGDWRMTLFGQV